MSNGREVSMAIGANGAPCTICLENVEINGSRSIARLKCKHLFHLDCIGSAFNEKGRMQCPNCRGLEDGHWRFQDVHISFGDAVLQIIQGLDDEFNSDMPAGTVSLNASAPVQSPSLEQEESSRTAENRGLQLEPMSPDLPPHESSEYFTRLLRAPSPIPDLNDFPGPSITENMGTSPAAGVRLPYLRRNMACGVDGGFGSDGLHGAFPLNHQILDRERVMQSPSSSSSMSTPYATGAQSTTGVRSADAGSQMFFQHNERRAYADATDHQRHQHVFGTQSTSTRQPPPIPSSSCN